MKRLIKSKTFLFFILFCLLASALLVVFNISQIQKYQIQYRNSQRKDDIEKVLIGIKKYISDNNNLPTTSNPDEKSFLPELLFNGNKPSGGVSIATLENMQGYFDTGTKDPQGNPYFVGVFEDQVVVYTTNFEVLNGGNEVFYDSFKIVPSLKS